jgi:hypothetical protein
MSLKFSTGNVVIFDQPVDKVSGNNGAVELPEEPLFFEQEEIIATTKSKRNNFSIRFFLRNEYN